MDTDVDPATGGSATADAVPDGGGRRPGGPDASGDPTEPDAIEPQRVNPEHAAFVLLGAALMAWVILGSV